MVLFNFFKNQLIAFHLMFEGVMCDKFQDILNPHNNDEVVMQRVSLSPMPKLIYAFGYSTNDGDAFIRHSPFYVGHLPFVPNGNLPWPPCLPRQSNDNKDKNVFSNPNQTPSIKTSLNPHAREFIGVQGSKVRFNPDADEFSPGGVVFEDRLSSASTMHSWNEKIDKHEFYNEDTENDDGEPGVMIGTDYDSSALQLSDQHAMGSSGVGFYVQSTTNMESQYNPEAEPFVPGYWKPNSSPKYDNLLKFRTKTI